MQAVAIGLIGFYQRRISPHKGYRCAHRAHHGDLSCSEYVKQTILAQGLTAACPEIRQRFADCRAAYVALQESQEQPAPKDDAPPAAKQGDTFANVCTLPCL